MTDSVRGSGAPRVLDRALASAPSPRRGTPLERAIDLLKQPHLLAAYDADAHISELYQIAGSLPWGAKREVLREVTRDYFALRDGPKRNADFAMLVFSGVRDTLTTIIDERRQPPMQALWWYHDFVSDLLGHRDDRINPDELLRMGRHMQGALYRLTTHDRALPPHFTVYGSAPNFRSRHDSDVDTHLPWVRGRPPDQHPWLHELNGALFQALGERAPRQGVSSKGVLSFGGASIEGQIQPIWLSITPHETRLAFTDRGYRPRLVAL